MVIKSKQITRHTSDVSSGSCSRNGCCRSWLANGRFSKSFTRHLVQCACKHVSVHEKKLDYGQQNKRYFIVIYHSKKYGNYRSLIKQSLQQASIKKLMTTYAATKSFKFSEQRSGSDTVGEGCLNTPHM